MKTLRLQKSVTRHRQFGSGLGHAGQAVLETVLMMFVIFAIWFAVTGALKKGQFFQTVFGKPWERLSNTIEFGIPGTDRKKIGPSHPTSYVRHSTLRNDNP